MIVDLNVSLLVAGTLLALLVGCLGAVLGAVAYFKALSTEKATHTVQFVSPFDTPEKRAEQKDAASDAMDVWADDDKRFNSINRDEKEIIDEEIFI